MGSADSARVLRPDPGPWSSRSVAIFLGKPGGPVMLIIWTLYVVARGRDRIRRKRGGDWAPDVNPGVDLLLHRIIL